MKRSPGKTYKLHFFNSANERQNHQILLLLNTILEFRSFQNSENKPLHANVTPQTRNTKKTYFCLLVKFESTAWLADHHRNLEESKYTGQHELKNISVNYSLISQYTVIDVKFFIRRKHSYQLDSSVTLKTLKMTKAWREKD